MKNYKPHFFIFLLFFAFVAKQSFAQNKKIDSLLALLKTDKEDTNKVNHLYQLSEECAEEDILKYAQPCLRLAEKLNYKKGVANAANNMGFVYNAQGQTKEALDYFHKALGIMEIMKDKSGIAGSLSDIGAIHDSQWQVEEALEYYHKSLAIQEEIKDKPGIARTLNNIGVVYAKQGRLKEALECYKKSLAIREEIKDKRGIAYTLNNIGTIYYQQGQLKEALEYYHKAFAIRRETKDKYGIAYSLMNIGGAYLKQKNYALALAYSDSSLVISKEIGYVECVRNAELSLCEIDSARGNGAGAFEHYKKYIKYRDRIANAEIRKASIKKQMQYEYEKKEAIAIATHQSELKNQQAIADEKNHKQKIVIWSIAIGLLLVAVFAGFVFKSLKTTRKQKHLIELKNKETEVQKKIIEEKQKDILDSIHYARRIQASLLPTSKYINKILSGRETRGKK